ncbi:protease inhibitor I42 family protein [Sinomonas humi]|uniref:protease inhibitor I42 family protein n=1 Tax=Sinomonas humi TaxID=1338436 RepID=UPI0018CD2A2C
MERTPETHEVRAVDAGAELEVALSSPGGSGYRWELAELGRGTELVTERPVEPSSSATPGSGRLQRFVLRAGAESGVVTFQLRRPWEPHPVRTHAVDIRVHP